ncbi:Two pore domain potassium channel family and Two pore domain potassium channel domain-containing protein [Strongyloides ratti]|uniref:Two pore domain potassium channel family and Two pore domain potassium channel domain-containing protein n=1 Tax=Strongyloides ratti TaxID=34506 RepID=A0A090LQK0_STRRB|nr:Two pore domain potassium channel family and Two pore domain potassium channel domain-containing protein [Strongyloides ratti]CEF69846.1 Two pore domain potassium channel family and Two pore domain potassium channel domain-containing protein [Strongyloides ratti]
MEETVKVTSYKIRLYVYFIIVIAALIFGTILFYYIEKDDAAKVYEDYINRCSVTKKEVIEKLNNEFLNKKRIILHDNMINDKIKDDLYKTITSLFNNIDTCHRQYESKKIYKFDMSKSAVFTFSILSRIGYGTVYPHNYGGHIFFFIFGIITIPIFISFYIELYESIMSNNQKNRDNGVSKKLSRIIMAIVILIVVGLSSILNHIFELALINKNITIGDHFLFFYDSVSKIGLGSYEPDNSIRFLLVEVPLIFIGIAFFSLYVNTVEQYIRHDLPYYITKKFKENKLFKEKWLKYIVKDVEKRNLYLLSDYRNTKQNF